MDPISAMALATSSFEALKKGFAAAKSIEEMVSDLSRWMSAISDIEQAEKEAKNPPIFKKLFAGQSIEAQALEAFAAKRKAQQQRDELKTYIQYTMGQSAWDELIRMEGQIRTQRQETLYRQRERRQRFIEILVLSIACIIGIGFFAVVVYAGLKNRGII